MGPFEIIGSIVLFLICVGLIIVILMQKDRSSGFSSTFGGSGGSDTYWSKNKGRSMEGALEKYTKIGAVLFMGVAFILYLMMLS